MHPCRQYLNYPKAGKHLQRPPPRIDGGSGGFRASGCNPPAMPRRRYPGNRGTGNTGRVPTCRYVYIFLFIYIYIYIYKYKYLCTCMCVCVCVGCKRVYASVCECMREVCVCMEVRYVCMYVRGQTDPLIKGRPVYTSPVYTTQSCLSS